MRKLTWVAALLGAFAWSSAGAQSTTREGRDDPAQQTKERASEAKQRAGEATERAGERMQGERSEQTGTAGQSGMSSTMTGNEKRHPLFEGKSNFDLEGKVQKATATSITVTREDLPPATLTIDRNTKVELDGQQTSARMLRPGQDVKASFNLQGSKAMAVEVKAEKRE
jgi:hypothetical protein